MNIQEAKAKLVRRAVSLQIGGFQPSDDLDANWFGKVNVAAPGEAWPMSDGKLLHALCQLNLTTFPFRPEGLDGIDVITVFIGPEELPDSSPNGMNWCLRTYSSLEGLVPLQQVATGSEIQALQMLPGIIEADYPSWDDVNMDLPPEISDAYEDHFENVGGFKVGGWPTLIQSEIYWAPWNQHPADPRYVFQIDSTEEGNWIWGDGGVGYFGRGTAPGQEDTWACEWQCY